MNVVKEGSFVLCYGTWYVVDKIVGDELIVKNDKVESAHIPIEDIEMDDSKIGIA